jgi:hypothetical protein
MHAAQSMRSGLVCAPGVGGSGQSMAVKESKISRRSERQRRRASEQQSDVGLKTLCGLNLINTALAKRRAAPCKAPRHDRAESQPDRPLATSDR